MPFVFNSVAFALIRTAGSSKRMVFSYVFILGGFGKADDRSSILKRFAMGLGIFLSLSSLYMQSNFRVKMSAMLSVSSFFRRGMVWAFTPDPVRARIAFFCNFVRFPGDLPHNAIP